MSVDKDKALKLVYGVMKEVKELQCGKGDKFYAPEALWGIHKL